MDTRQPCVIPKILQGSWFSWESGNPTPTVIDASQMSRRGFCVAMEKHHGDEYSFVFKEQTVNCYHCVKTFIRTLNVFEKFEGNLIHGIFHCKQLLDGIFRNYRHLGVLI